MADLTRLEQFLNHIAHPEDPVPEPLTRMEQNLLEIAENKDEAALPAVTAEDNGNVLTVVEDAWGKAAPSGGDVLVVSFSADPNTGTITADKTYADTMAAINANKLVLGASSGTLLTLNGTSGTSLEFVTEYWMPSQNKLLVMMLLFKADNSVEPVAEKQYTLTPAT